MDLSFDLKGIPPSNILKIAQKLASPSELVHLLQTNKYIYEICHSSRNILPLGIKKITIKGDEFNVKPGEVLLTPYNESSQFPRTSLNKIRDILRLFKVKCQEMECYCTFNSELLNYLLELINEYKMKIGEIHFVCGNSCTADEISKIIEKSGASSFILTIGGKREQFPPSTFDSITDKIILSDINYNDDDLLQFRAKYIQFSDVPITYYGINRLLQQWKRNEKELDGFQFTFDNSNIIEEAIAGTDANILYTPEWHEYSFIYDDGAFNSPSGSDNESEEAEEPEETEDHPEAIPPELENDWDFSSQRVLSGNFYIFWKPEDIFKIYSLLIDERIAMFQRCLLDDPVKELTSFRYIL